ncbi:uncharacterized protein LOC130022879 [Sorex fumeus]|uniref:uncharacterized protein LOC130022879 n=1 Tax=Sorex fumeus TaxID=62283 RepID=UPI0024AD74D1|nr:uncharacterized protein LOC130022879 [Sorex fumeus]
MKEAEETPEYREIGYPRILVMPQEEPAMPVDPFEAKVDEEDCIEELFLEEFNDTSEMSRDFMVNKEYDSYNDVLQECVNNREKSQVDYDTLPHLYRGSRYKESLEAAPELRMSDTSQDWVVYTMAWVPLLLTFLTHCTGVTSQNVVIQESLLSTNPGGTVTLTCGSSAGAVTTNNYASWIQQKPYQKPRGLIVDTSNKNPEVPARFSGSLLGNKAVLTITGAKEEDEAECFCVLWFSNHFHKSSLVTTAGGTGTLTCGSSTGGLVTSNHLACWIQQNPYQKPRGLIAGTSNRHPDVPARFSGSLLGNKAVLTITGAKEEDEAEYFCALWLSNHFHSDRWKWGSET